MWTWNLGQVRLCGRKGEKLRVGGYLEKFLIKNSSSRDLMQGEKFRNPVKADGKVVIITGSNTGIGKETALELARRKATVYLACRDLAKCEEARKEIILDSKNRNVFCRQLDLASFESIKNFVKHFKSEQVNCPPGELN